MSAAAGTYDFAVLTHATVDLSLWSRAVEELKGVFGAAALRRLELFGRPSRGEIIAVFGFAFTAYSSALRRRMEQEAERFKGRLVELSLLPEEERGRFLDRLAAFEARADLVSADPTTAMQAFREQMGLAAAATEAPVVRLTYSSLDDVLAVYSRSVAEGKVLIPTPRRMPQGAELRLIFIAPETEPLEASAKVLDSASTGDPAGLIVTLSPGARFSDFVAKMAHSRRQGRAVPPVGGRRQDPRYESCLTVHFENFPQLMIEYAANLSRGGLFAKTHTPPPVRSRVLLSVRLPNGEEVQTQAEVVHVITVEAAAASGCAPGVGLSFVTSSPEFDGRIAAVIEEYRARPPRVLLVDDDSFFRSVLADGLGQSGMQVETASGGHEALQRLTDGLFGLDLVVLDLNLPDLDGASLLWRIRKLGGEVNLPVVLLSGASGAELRVLKGSHGANEVISKDAPMYEVLARIRAVLGR